MMCRLNRIYALILRQFYLIRYSVPRLVSYAFWPTFSMLIWGYLNKFLYSDVRITGFTLSTLLGATLILNFFERSNVHTMWGFLEDVWARNIGNILISPIRPGELVTGYIINGLMMTVFGVLSACGMAYLLFDYSFFLLGLPLLAFILNLLLSGWCIGILLICLVLRFGSSGEHFGWMMAFVLVPFLAVYYPVSALPPAMQYISWALPPTYVFESLRELLNSGTFNKAHFYTAFGLNIVYLAAAVIVFMRELNKARKRGGLLSMTSE